MKQHVLFLLFGGGAYTSLELLYRQRTHFSMFCAGGVVFVLLHRICNQLQGGCRIITRCLTGSAVITAVELAFGLIFNRRHTVWDYTEMPFNWKGQVCLPYSAVWALLALPATALAGAMDRALNKQ